MLSSTVNSHQGRVNWIYSQKQTASVSEIFGDTNLIIYSGENPLRDNYILQTILAWIEKQLILKWQQYEKRKVTRIVRGRKTVDGAGVHLRRILGEQTVVDFDPFLMLDGFDSTNPQDYIKDFLASTSRNRDHNLSCQRNNGAWGQPRKQRGDPVHGMPMDDSRFRNTPQGDAAAIRKDARMPTVGQFTCCKKMVPPAYRDIAPDDIPVVMSDKATVRILSGSHRGYGDSGQFVCSDNIFGCNFARWRLMEVQRSTRWWKPISLFAGRLAFPRSETAICGK